MPQPTHINAYRAELAEAEKEEAQAHGRVEQLKETIATMEQSADQAAEAPVDEAAPESEQPAEEESPAEEAAEEAEEADEAPADVAAQDATLPSSDGGEPVDTVPSEPIVETPNDASDMPPASSEVPAASEANEDVEQPGAQDEAADEAK